MTNMTDKQRAVIEAFKQLDHTPDNLESRQLAELIGAGFEHQGDKLAFATSLLCGGLRDATDAVTHAEMTHAILLTVACRMRGLIPANMVATSNWRVEVGIDHLAHLADELMELHPELIKLPEVERG